MEPPRPARVQGGRGTEDWGQELDERSDHIHLLFEIKHQLVPVELHFGLPTLEVSKASGRRLSLSRRISSVVVVEACYMARLMSSIDSFESSFWMNTMTKEVSKREPKPTSPLRSSGGI